MRLGLWGSRCVCVGKGGGLVCCLFGRWARCIHTGGRRRRDPFSSFQPDRSVVWRVTMMISSDRRTLLTKVHNDDVIDGRRLSSPTHIPVTEGVPDAVRAHGPGRPRGGHQHHRHQGTFLPFLFCHIISCLRLTGLCHAMPCHVLPASNARGVCRAGMLFGCMHAMRSPPPPI